MATDSPTPSCDVATSAEQSQDDPRAFIPEPMSLAQTLEVPLPKLSGPLRSLAHVIVHHMRAALPWIPVAAGAVATRPRKTAAALALYWGVLCKQESWKQLIQRFAAYGCSNRPRLLNCMRQPYDPKKQYMLACHPHGFLCENVFNIAARSAPDFRNTGLAPPLPGVSFTLCFAPAVGWYPLYGEVCGKHITDASAASVRRVLKSGGSAMVCPGGFSEAVYTGASKEYDHAYLAGRVGFLKLAIEHGIDVAPLYCFGLSSVYNSWERERHWRSVFAQDSGLPGLVPFGKLGSSVPLNEDYVTALLEPFPTSRYTVDQLDQCSQDYAAYLQRCFDAYKACVPSEANKELLIIGKNVDENMALSMPRSRL